MAMAATAVKVETAGPMMIFGLMAILEMAAKVEMPEMAAMAAMAATAAMDIKLMDQLRANKVRVLAAVQVVVQERRVVAVLAVALVLLVKMVNPAVKGIQV